MKEEKFKNIIIIILGIICVGLLALVILCLTGVVNVNKKDELRENTKNSEIQKSEEIKEETKKEENTNTQKQNNTKKETELGKNDTFSMKTESGVVEVIGYPTIKQLSDFETDETFNYVYFNIVETKSSEFQKYIKMYGNNSFVGKNAIGLGCKIDNAIKYYNSSDKLGEFKYFELSKEDSKLIFNATKDKPVRLKLERLQYTSGTGAPACYSHITKVQVVK